MFYYYSVRERNTHRQKQRELNNLALDDKWQCQVTGQNGIGHNGIWTKWYGQKGMNKME